MNFFKNAFIQTLNVAALMYLTLSVSFAKSSFAQDSNRNSVRANISSGGWYMVWGETVNEAEYLKLTAAVAASVACECTAPVQGYFEDYYSRTVSKVQRNAPEIGQRVLEDIIAQAFDDPGRVLSYRGIKVAAGIATYNRWKRVVYDEPYTYKCKWEGPFGTWTWGVCNGMKRKEKRVPLPNWHQPYIKFRFTSSSNASSSSSSSSTTSSSGSGYNYNFKNNCSSPVRLAIRYENTRGEWVTRGWWNFDPGESAFLSSNGVRLASNNSIWYYYAEPTDNSGGSWSGEHRFSFNGRTLNMKKKKDDSGHNDWSISCN